MDEDAHPVPVTNQLDLHTFRPSEIGELLPEYFSECLHLGIRGVRVVHGKGTGMLRESVHGLLRRLPDVAEFHYPAADGNWGATWVILRPPTESTVDQAPSKKSPTRATANPNDLRAGEEPPTA